MKLIFLALLSMGLISCSAKKQNNMEDTETAIELTDSDELIESSDEELALSDEGMEESLEESSDDLTAENTADEMVDGEAVDADAMAMNDEEITDSEIVIDKVGESKTYTVQKGDTLMMISFRIYGDYSKWREIANLNSGKLIHGQIAPVGTELVYTAPAQEFTWNPEGNPYLVKSGDTLGGISTDTYGTMKFWRRIWDNNRPLIKDPNRIYAGFTLYTPIIEGREVATK